MRGPDLSGEVLDDRYRILERIAEGAMGVVYRGNRLALDRAVAIKVMHAELPEAMEGQKRFEREAKLMAKLEHPHCVSIIDYGLHGAKPYVVMELVRGQALFDAIAEGRFEIPRAVDVMRQVLSGLAHAHEQGIIHRDIKPANIMITPKAPLGLHVRILDFGLARLMEKSASLSNGVAVGTPSYMAPEQCRGDAIDARVDIYACGVVLFEMLTGKKPFIAKDPIAIVKKHLEQQPPRLSEIAPGDYGALEGVVARALAKKPADRYPSAVAMAEALEAALSGRGAPEATAVLPVTGDPSPSSVAIPITVGSSVIEPVVDPARAATEQADVEAKSDAEIEKKPSEKKPAKKKKTKKPDKKASKAKKPQRKPKRQRARSKPELTDLDEDTDDEELDEGASDSGVDEEAEDEQAEASEVNEAVGKRSAKQPSVNSSIRRMLPASRTRWLVLAVVLFAAASLAAVIVFYDRFASSDEATRSDAAAVVVTSPAPPDAAKHDPAADVIASAAQLKPDAAIDMLGKARRLYPQHAQLALALGRLYFGKMWWNDGLVHLRDAIKLDPSLKTDAELTKLALRAYLTPAGHDERLARFVVELGTPMIPLLDETSRTHPKPDVRNRATALRRRIR